MQDPEENEESGSSEVPVEGQSVVIPLEEPTPDDVVSEHEHEYPEDPNPPHGENTEEEMDVDDNN